ncbi:unnamed protein product [Ectocarpus sp. CCAP 1310/34]|nr:unnamed protein product [Ectocarpus sp. CCAP 1310/34]
MAEDQRERDERNLDRQHERDLRADERQADFQKWPLERLPSMSCAFIRVDGNPTRSSASAGTEFLISLTMELLNSFFQEAMVEIVEEAKKVLASQPQISVVYMVGGFSASPLLQGHVTDALQTPSCRVQVVEKPGVALAVGAALFGRSESAIVARKARLTYGTRSVTRYDEEDPNHTRRKGQARYIGGTLYLEKFSCYVEKGVDLPVGTGRQHTFHPVTERQNEIEFDVCISLQTAADIEYVKDEGVNHKLCTLKTLTVPVDMSVRLSERGVVMKLYFGGTDLGIKCTRCTDGHEVAANTVFVEDIEDTRYGIDM